MYGTGASINSIVSLLTQGINIEEVWKGWIKEIKISKITARFHLSFDMMIIFMSNNKANKI